MSASVTSRPKSAGSDFAALNRQIADAAGLPITRSQAALLFPAMPTPNLPKAQPIVRAYCEQAGISYEETDIGSGSFQRPRRRSVAAWLDDTERVAPDLGGFDDHRLEPS
jgi:hypothetical protein